jgi:phospholipase C
MFVISRVYYRPRFYRTETLKMSSIKRTLGRNWRLTTALCSSALTLAVIGFATAGHSEDADNSTNTRSPIKHVIVLIGENRGFDHTFGIYTPKGRGQTVRNLLSEGIINADGTPGPNIGKSQQFSVAAQPSWYFGAPDAAKTPYGAANVMPQPNTNGAPEAQSETGAPFLSTAIVAFLGEADISTADYVLLTTGATGLPQGVLDTRVPGAGTLTGPFPLLGPNLTDDDYTGDMTHRFFQAAQQQDCSLANATRENPSGCLNDLFPFVMGTYSSSNKSEGNEMGFLNAEQEQASFLKQLADRFTLSDNFHQSFLGGTGANHVMFGTGYAVFWSDGNGNATTPPVASLIANPNPAAGTVNQYQVDGNFVECADASQPGVLPIVRYLQSLPYRAEPNCQPGHFYMVNNTNPGFLPNGTVVPSPATAGSIPPSPVRTIGDALSAKNVSWAYFGGSYNDAVILSNEAVAANPASPNLTEAALADPAHALGIAYCQICNPFQYASSIMGNAAVRQAHVQDTVDMIADIQNNTLPSVSIGKPDGLLDGHPQSSKIDLFEGYVQHVLDALEANPKLMAETAVFITWDEAGGYWDSGYVQPIDFFGDGPRIPLLILSPYTTGGKIYHHYSDHVSILKFIERNWDVPPITNISRDNLPNPRVRDRDPYVPDNSPAIDDLFDAFDFSHPVNQPFTE